MTILRFATVLLISLLFATPSFGVWAVLDKVPGATVILPFFEVGINIGQNPQDTLPIIYNRGGSKTLHWEVYDIDGSVVFFGNQTVMGAGTWAFSMRDLINANASPVALSRLTQGGFYRGFMTIDAVTTSTDLSPFFNNYPFSTDNSLLGYAYYARLQQGSANGLSLPSLEYTTDASVNARINGFYGNEDVLEEMDINARICAEDLMKGNSCVATTDQDARLRNRVFQSNAINGQTRIIVFAWDTTRSNDGGPSAICSDLGTCATQYDYDRFRENGTLADTGTLRLDHVVNVIEINTGATAPGEHVIFGVEDPSESLQLFTFSFNSAQPAGNPNTNWDAIFEGSVDP